MGIFGVICALNTPRPIRGMVDTALQALSPEFEKMYSTSGRPSIAPEKLLRALLLQVLYSVRSERMLMEQLQYNLLFRWFVGLDMDEAVWVPTVFSKNRDRLLEGDIAEMFFAQVLDQARGSGSAFAMSISAWMGRLIEAWAGQKSFQRKDGRRTSRTIMILATRRSNFHGEKRSNETHESTTDPDARLARKSGGHEAKLAYCGNVLIENRNGLVVDAELLQCNGTAERDAAMVMAERLEGNERGDGGRRQGLRYQGLREGDAGDECDAACGAERQAAWRQRDRRANDAARWISDQSDEAEADRRSIRLAKDGGAVTQDPASRGIQSRMGVHLRGHCLQPRADAESAVTGSSLRISPGRSVSEPGNRAFGHVSPYRETSRARVNGLQKRNRAEAISQRVIFSAPC